MKLSDRSSGFGLLETMLVIIFLIIVALISLHLYHESHLASKTNSSVTTNTTSPSNSSSNQYPTLTPATVPSKIAVCNQQISFTSNGDSGPVTCTNGDLNATEWNALAANEPQVLTLGYGATFTQVQASLCRDTSTNESNVIEQTIYQIATLYYGWSFPSNPSVVLANGTC